jgi:hypothetical protein
MLENVVDVLIRKVKDQVVTDKNMQEIPLAYLMTRDIPESVKHFFDQEVELWIREEEQKFTSSDRFDYDMPEVRMLIDQIFDFLKQNARFHLNKFNQLLERAVKLEMNYLIAPQRTLSQFIFKDNQIVSTIEVYDTLKYFFRYQYYKDAISDYFNSKYLHQISQDQFVELIAKIDENVFRENRYETTLKTIKTITGFLSEASEGPIETLDFDLLSAMFKDRNLTTYLQLIDQLRERGLDKISLIDLETILQSESIESMVKEEQEAEEEEVIAPMGEETQLRIQQIKDIEESKPTVEVDSIEIGEMTAPVTEEEEEEEEEEYEEEEEVVAAAKQPANVADEMANFVASQIKSDKPLEDINNLIVGRNRKKVIKKLFKKKEEQFKNFINILNQQAAWKDASVIIDEEFYERGINPYSKEAIMFSDIIYLRFFPKDKYVGEQQI